jgi:hypothetical protein
MSAVREAIEALRKVRGGLPLRKQILDEEEKQWIRERALNLILRG